MSYVKIHYLDDMRASYDDNVATLPHTLVWEGEIGVRCDTGRGMNADDLELCEVIFDRFNRHDSPTQHPALDELGLRSLSVGDLVEITPGRVYLCASFGFDMINSDPVGDLMLDALNENRDAGR